MWVLIFNIKLKSNKLIIYRSSTIYILYTRKKRGGNLSPRKVAMTNKVFEILSRRNAERKSDIPWVFWHRNYYDPATGKREILPFGYRDSIMKTLCKRAKVRRFGFHALRHAGASIMDQNGVPIGSIQRILGHENRSTT